MIENLDWEKHQLQIHEQILSIYGTFHKHLLGGLTQMKNHCNIFQGFLTDLKKIKASLFAMKIMGKPQSCNSIFIGKFVVILFKAILTRIKNF